MSLSPIYMKDFYKAGHINQYPPGTHLLFSNFTPRKHDSVFLGLKYFMKQYLEEAFDKSFFKYHNGIAWRSAYDKIMKQALGSTKSADEIRYLHDLDYLPIAIYALPEGTLVPKGVPAMVIYNTHPDFYWLPNMLETLLSCTLWGSCNSATIARNFRNLMEKYAAKTCDDNSHVDYQCHDFSMRGMFGLEASIISGMAHLHYFKGTDTIPALLANQYFNDKEINIASIPATEHSVMSAYGKDHEFETFRRLITEIYPSGLVSIVSDTWNLWNVLVGFMPRLRNDIKSRDGKVIIRPDSGDPLKILCGDPGHFKLPYRKGVMELLWDVFGGTTNSKGYRVLDKHIGCIYGDGISIDRAKEILAQLADKEFASSNIVFGIGSYTYQYNTRDTLGWAMKSTYIEIDGKGHNIQKDPITDDGTKKSATGILKVIKNKDGELKLHQECTWEQFHAADNELKCVYMDGHIK